MAVTVRAPGFTGVTTPVSEATVATALSLPVYLTCTPLSPAGRSVAVWPVQPLPKTSRSWVRAKDRLRVALLMANLSATLLPA